MNSKISLTQRRSLSNQSFLYDKPFFKAVAVNQSNFATLIVGTWTAAQCADDFWTMDEDGNFSSQIPPSEDEPEGELYAWEGKFSFDGDIYIEKGQNNSNEPEHNEANLLYIPHHDWLIHKSIRSLDALKKPSEANNYAKSFYYATANDYYYFHRCP